MSFGSEFEQLNEGELKKAGPAVQLAESVWKDITDIADGKVGSAFGDTGKLILQEEKHGVQRDLGYLPPVQIDHNK